MTHFTKVKNNSHKQFSRYRDNKLLACDHARVHAQIGQRLNASHTILLVAQA